MTQFSERLKEYVSHNGLSVTKLSEVAGIERTLLQKYISGARTPKNSQEVERLGQAMMLQFGQRKKLQEAYYRSIYGSRTYDSFYLIKGFLEGNSDWKIAKDMDLLRPEELYVVKDLPEAGGKCFSGKLQVEDALLQVFSLAFREKRECPMRVRVLLQPDQSGLMRMLLRLCSRFPVEVEHIICLDRRQDNDNLSLLFSVFAFEYSDIPYQSKYYYEDVASHRNSMNLLTNMILVEKHVFLCSPDGDECLILRDEQQTAFFRRQYERIAQHTELLGIVNRNITDLASGGRVIGGERGLATYICYYPCWTHAFREDMLWEHLLLPDEGKREVISLMKEMQQRMIRGKQERQFFTEAGLRTFLENGKIADYPEKMYRVPEMKVRLTVLENLIREAETGHLELHLIRGDQAVLAPDVQISVSVDGGAEFLKLDEGFGRRIVVKEPNICEVIVQFVDFAWENSWFYGQEETLRRMKEIGEEYGELI